MNPTTKILTYVVIIVHLLFFLLEAVLWMNPLVYNLLINSVTIAHPTQALVLKNLFVNQGFYNLFLVLGGVVGLFQLKKGKLARYETG